jgi:hypothetical protein
MEVRDHLHASAALPPGNPPLPVNFETETGWGFCVGLDAEAKRKNIAPDGSKPCDCVSQIERRVVPKP